MGVLIRVSGIDLASFYHFSIGFINFPDRVVFVYFIPDRVVFFILLTIFKTIQIFLNNPI